MLRASVIPRIGCHVVSRRLCTKPEHSRTYKVLLESAVDEQARKRLPLQIIAGAKGVGKTHLLRNLYEETKGNEAVGHSFFFDTPQVISDQQMEEFLVRFRKQQKVTLFVDNLQGVFLLSKRDFGILRLILREISRPYNEMNWKVLAAVSRHGMKTLVEENFFPADEAEQFMLVHSPDRRASQYLIDKTIRAERIRVSDEIKTYILDHFGDHALHVLQFVKLLRNNTKGEVKQEDVDIALDEYSMSVQNSINFILKKDEESFVTNEEDKVIYRKTTALLASGCSLEPKDLMSSPVFLPWTMLKKENGHIKVVSDFLRNVCVKYLTGRSPGTLLDMIRDTSALPTSSATVAGNLFELLFKTKLEVTEEIEFFALDENNEFYLDSLKLPLFKIETVAGHYFPELKEEVSPGKAIGYYGPNTVEFDIVLYFGGKSHALQLSISQLQKKVPMMSIKGERKGKRKEQKFDYQYLATPHLVNKDVLDALLKKESVKKEFDRRKLRVIVPESVFDESDICKLRSYLSIRA